MTTRTTTHPRARKKGARPARNAHRRPHAIETTPLRELWLAGLGAAAATGEATTDFVDLLVAKGKQAEPRVVATADRALAMARKSAQSATNELRSRAKVAVEGALDRIGVNARPRTKNVLHRLGDLAEAIL
jgi:polyhydroxyalkanoate synthesis regulator phasin